MQPLKGITVVTLEHAIAAPLVVTLERSSSVTGKPVSRFFTFDVA